jgi:hypothetical protein
VAQPPGDHTVRDTSRPEQLDMAVPGRVEPKVDDAGLGAQRLPLRGQLSGRSAEPSSATASGSASDMGLPTASASDG